MMDFEPRQGRLGSAAAVWPGRLSTFDIRRQPDQTTCGPTCLDAVYRYYRDPVPLPRLVAETRSLPEGGTLLSLLACHALGRGYRATIYSCDLRLLDPTWFRGDVDIKARLREQREHKTSPRLRIETDAYLDFLEQGGVLKFEDLTASLLRTYLERAVPILTGLSATYLYRTPREKGPWYDDVRGETSGHFVVLCGYDASSRQVRVADPYVPNPFRSHYYSVEMDRLIGAIYLGILTCDANLLVLEPQPR